MPESAVFDTRYFNQAYYNDSPLDRAWLRDAFTGTRRRLISSVTLHEVYRLALQGEGREVARLRCVVMERDFTVVPLDGELAVMSAELRHGHGLSLADGAIAATAMREGCPVISDDPHFKEIEGLKIHWIK
jgi:predicted nucleic acid-binding protein